MAADLQTVAVLAQAAALVFYAGSQWRMIKSHEARLNAHAAKLEKHGEKLASHDAILQQS